jgi:mRNA-degrading endonuclease RelE of RelBE toxin-antitoxin system
MSRGRCAANLVAHFFQSIDGLPSGIRETLQRKIDEMGIRLETFTHKRLQGRPEFKLRVGDYRVLYEFDMKLGAFISTTWATGARFTNEVNERRRVKVR